MLSCWRSSGAAFALDHVAPLGGLGAVLSVVNVGKHVGARPRHAEAIQGRDEEPVLERHEPAQRYAAAPSCAAHKYARPGACTPTWPQGVLGHGVVGQVGVAAPALDARQMVHQVALDDHVGRDAG